MNQEIDTLTSLGGLSVERFLADYWQQKPLLVRNAVAPHLLSISGDELAGLALEDNIESRLITERDGNWHVQHGPFSEQHFASLPQSHWTLLVQAVDHYLPEVHHLLNLFRFVPNWRLDDIMISFAVAGGSVGPHFDQYDVFLIQGEGQRRWQIGQNCDGSTGLKPGTDLQLVDDFHVQEDWVLNPGDMLYLPPAIAHYGVALDNCITYSVGFRSPSITEAFDSLIDFVALNSTEENRYRDSGEHAQPGEIAPAECKRFMQWMQAQLLDYETVSTWFGREMTRGKYTDDVATLPEQTHNEVDLDQDFWFEEDQTVFKTLDSRWAYLPTQDGAKLFVSGIEFSVSLAIAKLLCEQTKWPSIHLRSAANQPADRITLHRLFNLGLLYLDEH